MSLCRWRGDDRVFLQAPTPHDAVAVRQPELPFRRSPRAIVKQRAAMQQTPGLEPANRGLSMAEDLRPAPGRTKSGMPNRGLFGPRYRNL